MGKSLIKTLSSKPPRELQRLLENFHLVGEEMPEDYFNLFDAIAMSAKPAGSIDWIYIKDVADLTWEIWRERAIKVDIVNLKQKEVVLDLLKSTGEDPTSLDAHVHRIFFAAGEVERWSTDPVAKKEINAKLAARGYPPSEVLALAYIRGAAEIDAVERRIASYEMRKTSILRELERRNERLSRELGRVSSEILEAEFSEAAE